LGRSHPSLPEKIEDEDDWGMICARKGHESIAPFAACPEGATELSPGFQPWDRPPRSTLPKRAPDRIY
jgi:hypothetical protein